MFYLFSPEMILIGVHKAKTLISQEAGIIPRKLDWMLTDKADELRTIMNDNGTYVQFSPIGSQTGQLVVYGDRRVTIARTIRMIMQLVSHTAASYYVR